MAKNKVKFYFSYDRNSYMNLFEIASLDIFEIHDIGIFIGWNGSVKWEAAYVGRP